MFPSLPVLIFKGSVVSCCLHDMRPKGKSVKLKVNSVSVVIFVTGAPTLVLFCFVLSSEKVYKLAVFGQQRESIILSWTAWVHNPFDYHWVAKISPPCPKWMQGWGGQISSKFIRMWFYCMTHYNRQPMNKQHCFHVITQSCNNSKDYLSRASVSLSVALCPWHSHKIMEVWHQGSV